MPLHSPIQFPKEMSNFVSNWEVGYREMRHSNASSLHSFLPDQRQNDLSVFCEGVGELGGILEYLFACPFSKAHGATVARYVHGAGGRGQLPGR